MPESAEELRRLDDALAAFGEDAEKHFGVRLMRASLERQRDDVLATAAGELSLQLRRAEGTGAEVSLVAGILNSLQESIASIAQGLAGPPTARGLIPGAIKESVQLRIANANPGSLNMRLVPTQVEQEPLFEDEDRSLLDLSVDRLFGLLGKAEGEPSELLADVAEVGPRASLHIQALSHWLAEFEASASLAWRSPFARTQVRVEARGARHLDERLREVEEEVREVVFTGRLVGGNLVRKTFELEIDPAEGTVIGGRAAEETLADVERLFGQPCTAILQVQEARLPSGETRESHLLKQLNE